MKTKRAIRWLFSIAAMYDGLFGVAFLLFSGALFEWFGVISPNHPGYVQFPAALLVIFAIMFAAVAIDPVKNRDLILYGILLKVSYCSVILSHWLTTGIPDMWKPFCVSDAIFLTTFIWAWAVLRKEKG